MNINCAEIPCQEEEDKSVWNMWSSFNGATKLAFKNIIQNIN